MEGHPILRAGNSCDVTFASRVLDKFDVARLDGDLFSSLNFELSPAAERDHVPATWATMPIGNVAGRSPMEFGPCDLHHLESLTRTSARELHLYLFGVRLIV